MKTTLKITVWILSALFLALSTISIKNRAEQMQEKRVAKEMVRVLDLHFFGFSKNDAMAVFNALGEESIAIYKHIEQNEDLVYPISYSLFFAVNLWLLALANGISRRGILLLLLLPIIVFTADVFENIHIAQLCGQFPDLQEQTVEMASAGNFLKWTFVVLNALAGLAFLVKWLVTYIKG